MDFAIVWVFGVTALALVLFVSGRVSVDQVAIAVPVLLLLGGVVTPEQAVAGLSSRVTVTVAAILVLGLGLEKSGAVDAVGRWAVAAPLGGPRTRLFLICLIAGLVSPFLNNTAVVAVLLPVVIRVARSVDRPPSTMLIPLSYAAILGGTITLIGTSTNLVVHGMAQSRGLDALSMFSIAPLGLIYFGVGLLYLFTVGAWLLPRREPPPDLARHYDVRSFETELVVTAESPAVGSSLAALGWADTYGVLVRSIHRPSTGQAFSGPRTPLAEGDLLLVRGQSAQLVLLAAEQRLAGPADVSRYGRELDDEEGHLVELMVGPGSHLIDRTLRQIRFQSRYGVVVVGIQHHGRAVPSRLGDVRLAVGDLLLVQGRADALETLVRIRGLVPLGERDHPRPTQRWRAVLAACILVAVVATAGLGLTSILASAMVGVVALVFTGCLRLDDIYRDMDWRVIALLAGLVPLGLAMDSSGASRLIADLVAGAIHGLPPAAAIGLIYLFASLITEIMSNAAAALLLTPIALEVAHATHANPYALIVAVMFGCSASFMTPMGYQTNAMVHGPGGYRFIDFVRVGLPLNLLLLALASLLIPLFWPVGG
ncbi:MAG: SLC13 family permease [Deltaproteobacteria bacterium]|nr:SLC13 family permease [Deltaproteobacteria bacterium]MCB9788032.1 SLC13 family permease [Deltaproteobacteria bacterium]